jgi:predicted TIM-barrel fold metal-dependent hydrolase
MQMRTPDLVARMPAVSATFGRRRFYSTIAGLAILTVVVGFAPRIMFGSDFPVSGVGKGIDAILAGDFLSADQKADILCGNAQRFFRLPETACQP